MRAQLSEVIRHAVTGKQSVAAAHLQATASAADLLER